jgi:hypothetical protein
MRNIDSMNLRPSAHSVDKAGVIMTPVARVFVFTGGTR